MQTSPLFQRNTIIAILIAQFIPLILLPVSSFTMTSQEWWLPAFLMLLTVIAVIELAVRKNLKSWPWDLLGFAQGFNIISRLMMLMPRATALVNGEKVFNTTYFVFGILSMLLSVFVLWYISKPETRNALVAA
jgi:hypothetical protein